jgi:hypothetical protein
LCLQRLNLNELSETGGCCPVSQQQQQQGKTLLATDSEEWKRLDVAPKWIGFTCAESTERNFVAKSHWNPLSVASR